MPVFSFSATQLGSFTAISFLSTSQPHHHSSSSSSSSSSSFLNRFNFPKCPHNNNNKLTPKTKIKMPSYSYHTHTIKAIGIDNTSTQIEENPPNETLQQPSSSDPQQQELDSLRQARISSDWKAARAYKDSGHVFNGRVQGFNGGGLLLRFYSLSGFLPYPELSPLHLSKEPEKTPQDIAKGLLGSLIAVKVILVDEDKRKLIFSEKEAAWSKFSGQVKVGDVFEGRVTSVEDYGAFVCLRFPDGLYHLTGLVHITEVSWDLVQDVRDILKVGDEVRVKVINVDREKSRIRLSIKQLEEDPLLETLDKVIPQDGSADSDSSSWGNSSVIQPLPGLETILQELLQEDGIYDARISRQGFEKRVVSQDLQLWLSNAPPINQRFTLLARAGRQVQEILLTTSLDQEGIKSAIQRALERVP